MARSYRHRIKVMEPVAVQNATTGEVFTYWQALSLDSSVTLDAVPADVLTGPGREFREAGAVQSEVVFRVSFRWFDGLLPTHRIEIDGLGYDIASIERDQTGRREYRVSCKGTGKALAAVPVDTGYPLGDDGTLAATFGFGALTMSAPDYNEGEHTYNGTTTGGAALGLPSAATYLTTQAVVVGADDVLHIEFEPIVPSCYEAGVQGFPLLGLGLIMSTGGVFGGLFGTVGIHDDDGSTPIYRGSLVPDTVRATADGPVRMSVDIDGTDGTVTIRTTDGNSIVSSTTFTPGIAFTPYLFVSDGPSPLSGNVVISLVPDASSAALPHNPGAVDLLGNQVP